MQINIIPLITLHYIDSASLNNSEELHIRNFQLRTCVRKRQSLKCLYFADFKMEDIENWLTSGMRRCTNTKDPKEIKR